MVGFYCQVCRQTFFEGKGHIYGKTHQERLKRILAKFYEKVKEARKTIKNPAVVKFDSTKHLVNMWCHCCQQELLKHTTNNNVTVLHGGLLEHMASAEHKKKTGAFWWECNADQKLKSKFLVSEEEIEKFKTEVAKALDSYEEKEDEYIKQQAAHIREVEQRRLEILQSSIEPESAAGAVCGEPECGSQEPGNSSSAFSCGYIGPVVEEDTTLHHLEEPNWEDVTHPLTFIGHQDASMGGNIHSGATPPWLMDDPEEGSSAVKQIGPSHEEFVKHKELEKLRKLPPNRVGANFDHASQTDAGWLPSFGRVWNSGRRWQSRHQFRAEEGANKSGQKRKKDDPCKEKKKPKQEPWDSSHNS
ncbi:coiled-coil domain-containing protein 84 [Erpetoichthys calabaricus]|uniref:Centrosomal AT-AC splicing factor n=1 Tax=Erpetoichthys calabaricus TaxID=27687 RepID=A0A8C4SLT4_ERPCA|nr:coiled-coil domain-containing protein 84 [Erpetoichthys calabaricus]